VETYTACDEPLLPGRAAELSSLLAACDVFSPNEAEAASILGTAAELSEGEGAAPPQFAYGKGGGLAVLPCAAAALGSPAAATGGAPAARSRSS
jgi:sugar/nucleoside kinase (ribokinase family)